MGKIRETNLAQPGGNENESAAVRSAEKIRPSDLTPRRANRRAGEPRERIIAVGR
jgi:hypothetical protein